MTDPRIEAAVDAAWSHTTQFASGETFDQYSKRKPYEGGEFRKSILAALAAADAVVAGTSPETIIIPEVRNDRPIPGKGGVDG
ncbi:hypothetical protein HK26_04200 [Acetobacter okinawensis]|uniref:Uncharacterized protein n=1 Tax=Acetobacter okinawensis TaxID=1076594 RepID=A0A252BY02_9PROT|nr:hypothetical protein HK26_04200 [Acetobacter okinawensis]